MMNKIQNNRKENVATDNSFGDLQIRKNVGRLLADEIGIKRALEIDEEFETLQNKIKELSVSQKELSINTLKRLSGKIEIERPYNFATATVKAVCEFLEKESWEDVIEAAADLENFITKDSRPNVTTLEGPDENGNFVRGLRKGDTFWLKYLPNRILELEVLGDEQYKVVTAAFTVFKPGDVLISPTFRRNEEFRVSEVIRGAKRFFDIKSAHKHVITKVARTKHKLDE